jgi:hypothetical protein
MTPCQRQNYCVVENRALLGWYAVNSGNCLPKFRDNLSVPSSGFKNQNLDPDDGTDRLSQNIDKKLPLLTTQYPKGAQFSATSRRKPGITYGVVIKKFYV